MKEIVREGLLGTSLGILTLAAVYLFYEKALLLTSILLVIGLVMLRRWYKPGDIIFYIAGGVFGALAEIIIISAGSWQYSSQHFLGIPLWLPLLWGAAALFMRNMWLIIRRWRG